MVTLRVLVEYVLLIVVLTRYATVCGHENGSGKHNSRHSNRTGFWCPELCKCSFPAKIVDCSGHGLTRIPIVAALTTRLYLHDNYISRLEADQLYYLHQLTYLILASNTIVHISEGSFRGLHSLKYLILDRNNVSDIPANVFKGLNSLETVSLAHNRIRHLPQQIFSTNHHISLINIQNNLLERVENGTFSHLKELHTLNLQNNILGGELLEDLDGCCSLTVLRLSSNHISLLPSSELHFPSLQMLSLSHNVIEELPPNIFKHSPNITRLEIGDNLLTTVPATLLQHTPHLQTIYLHRNNISSLPENVFEEPQHLKDIFLNHNQLRAFPSMLFHNLSSLISLHLDDNKLRLLRGWSFSHLPHLEKLYLQHNQISTISENAFVELPQLKYLAIYENCIPVEKMRAGVLNALKSLIKIHMDPFPCSCKLSQLSVWNKRHAVKGIVCNREDGSEVALSQAWDECTVQQDRQTPSNLPAPLASDAGGGNSVFVSVESVPVTTDDGQPTNTESESNGTGTAVKLEWTVTQLQYRVSRLEEALTDSCAQWICIHHGVRLEAGDMWSEGAEKCFCLEGGEIKCSSVDN